MSTRDQAFQAYNASAQGSITITPSDSALVSPNCRGLYVGTAGSVAVQMLDGSTPIFSAIPAGTILPIQFNKVLATGTTASSMIGLW